MNNVKCFACDKYSHYAQQFPSKKKTKSKISTTAFAQMDELVEKFEEFVLVSCLLVTMTCGSWFVHKKSSHHMMGPLHQYGQGTSWSS